MSMLDDLPLHQRAELRATSMADLRGELESCATSVAELEERLTADPEQDDAIGLAAWGLMLERRCEIAQAEIERRLRLGRPLSGPTYSREFIRDLKARIDLPELIVSMHDGTRLKRAGSHYEGLCPYHADNDASLHVWQDHYHCFGCQEHGDCLDWLLKMACHGWREAVEYAAKWAMVPLSVTERPLTVLEAYER